MYNNVNFKKLPITILIGSADELLSLPLTKEGIYYAFKTLPEEYIDTIKQNIVKVLTISVCEQDAPPAGWCRGKITDHTIDSSKIEPYTIEERDRLYNNGINPVKLNVVDNNYYIWGIKFLYKFEDFQRFYKIYDEHLFAVSHYFRIFSASYDSGACFGNLTEQQITTNSP